MKRAILSIDYDEVSQKSYQGIMISVFGDSEEDNEAVRFDTGNPCIDYFDYLKWSSKNDINSTALSSSFDHFFMDGKEWVSCWVEIDKNADGNHKLYLSSKDFQIQYGNELYFEKWCSAIAFIIPNNDSIKTFTDLKNYYKNYKERKQKNN